MFCAHYVTDRSRYSRNSTFPADFLQNRTPSPGKPVFRSPPIYILPENLFRCGKNKEVHFRTFSFFDAVCYLLNIIEIGFRRFLNITILKCDTGDCMQAVIGQLLATLHRCLLIVSLWGTLVHIQLTEPLWTDLSLKKKKKNWNGCVSWSPLWKQEEKKRQGINCQTFLQKSTQGRKKSLSLPYPDLHWLCLCRQSVVCRSTQTSSNTLHVGNQPFATLPKPPIILCMFCR